MGEGAPEREARFTRMWSELAEIGRRPGEDAGYSRFSWTPVDLELRAWFRARAEGLGLSVEQDGNGNLWAWWDVPSGDRRDAVVTGSHLDSVPAGGAYDGPLGVVSGLLAVQELRDRGIRPARPIAVVDFTDEEGARFNLPCLGSRLMTGALDPAVALDRRDADGVTLAEAMRAAGADPAAAGPDPDRVAGTRVFVELHVEQGRGLAPLGAPLGLATGIWPHGRWRFTLTGEPNHAGTTLLEDRRDPVVVLAELALAARRIARERGARATLGRVEVVPNVTNGIASTATGWLDARAASDDEVQDLVDAVAAAARDAAVREGVTVEVVAESVTPLVSFDAALTDRLDAVLGGVPRLPTAAGHDAGSLAARVPTAMIFVRNDTGASHTPAESADVADCVAGVQALAAVLEDLTREDRHVDR